MLMKFNADGVYMWADIGGVIGKIEREIEWDSSWDDKKDRLRLVDNKIVIAPDISYKRIRKRAYPSWQEQMDMQYEDEVNGTTTWKDAVEAVKTKWPKDNSGPVE